MDFVFSRTISQTATHSLRCSS